MTPTKPPPAASERDRLAEAYATGNHSVSFPDTFEVRAFRAGWDAAHARDRAVIEKLEREVAVLREGNDAIGGWMSAAMEWSGLCAEARRDYQTWWDKGAEADRVRSGGKDE